MVFHDMKVVKSLIENCFAVLELLAEEARDMRLSELADRLDLQRSGTHRVLTTLCELGWAEQNPQTELYRLTLKLPAIGHRFMQAAHLTDVCQPIVDRVARESQELVRLAVLANGNLTTIAHSQGAQGSLVCQSRIFPILPLHVTASGKAWLATLPEEEALKRVLQVGFGAPGDFGPRALRTVDALRDELRATKKRGYGTALEEAESGVSSVAVVIQPKTEVVAVLAVVAPAIRLSKTRATEIAKIAKQGATDLELVWPLRLLQHGPAEGAFRAAS